MTSKEWHSFGLGLAHGFAWVNSLCGGLPLGSYVSGEEHYYGGGVAVGVLLFIGVAVAVVSLFV